MNHLSRQVDSEPVAPDVIPTTLSKALVAGLLRGAKFGAVVAAGVMAPLAAVGWCIALWSPQSREREFSNALDVAKVVGSTVGGLVVAACWGALVGSVIMAIGEVARHRRSTV